MIFFSYGKTRPRSALKRTRSRLLHDFAVVSATAYTPIHRPIVSFLRLPAVRRLGQSKEQHLFSGHGADVVVQAHNLDAGRLMDHRFDGRPYRLDQLGPHLLDQSASLLDRRRVMRIVHESAHHNTRRAVAFQQKPGRNSRNVIAASTRHRGVETSPCNSACSCVPSPKITRTVVPAFAWLSKRIPAR